jgi:hypothetical protein
MHQLLTVSYDGNTIGSVNLDRMQNVTGYFSSPGSFYGAFTGAFAPSNDWYDIAGAPDQPGQRARIMTFEASRVARTGNETAGAWTAVLICISF